MLHFPTQSCGSFLPANQSRRPSPIRSRTCPTEVLRAVVSTVLWSSPIVRHIQVLELQPPRPVPLSRELADADNAIQSCPHPTHRFALHKENPAAPRCL